MNYLKQAWLVIVLCVVFGALLAGVDASLKPMIEQNAETASRGKVPDLLLPPDLDGRDGIVQNLHLQKRQIALQLNGTPREYTVFEATDARNGKLLGWVVQAGGKGWDNFQLLVGLTPDGSRITGMVPLEQNETPGLGSKIKEAPFRQSLKGLEMDKPIRTTKNGPGKNEFRAITGATISSEGVAETLNRVAKDVSPTLRKWQVEHQKHATTSPASSPAAGTQTATRTAMQEVN